MAFVLTGTIDRSDEPTLVARLWDLPSIARAGRRLLRSRSVGTAA